MMDKQTCNNCACDSVCDHNWNGWETCGNWQPVLVRCKDCTYAKDAAVNEKGYLICPASGMEITDRDYCSYGERRADHETD